MDPVSTTSKGVKGKMALAFNLSRESKNRLENPPNKGISWQTKKATVIGWHLFYIQNSRSKNDNEMQKM